MDTFVEPATKDLLRAISEMSLDLANVGDRHALIAAMLRRARELLGSDMAYLSLNDLSEGETYIDQTDGVRTEGYRTIRMPFGTGVLGAAAAGGTAVHTPDYLADERIIHLDDIDERVGAEGVRAIAGAPMRVGGRVVGAFLVAHREPRGLGPRARDALEQFAVHAAIALDQARRGTEITRLRREREEYEAGNPRETRLLEDLVRLDERLMGAMIGASHDVAAVFSVLEETLAMPVALHEAHGRRLRGRSVVDENDPLAWRLRSAIDSSLAGGAPSVVRLDTGDYAVMAVAAAGSHLGTLVVQSAASTSLAAIAHAAPFIAVMMLLNRAAAAEGELEQLSLVEDLIDRRAAVRPSTIARAAALGLMIDEPAAVLVVDLADADRDAAVRASRAALSGRGALLSTHDAHLCVLLNADDAERVGMLLSDSLSSARVEAVVGASHSSGRGAQGLRRAHSEATELTDAARALGWRTGLADLAGLGVVGALVRDKSGVTARAIIDRELGPVLAYDRERGTELADTLHAFFDGGGALATSAVTLRVHPNTVRQRLERVDSLLGEGWREPSRRLRVHMALQLWRVSRFDREESSR